MTIDQLVMESNDPLLPKWVEMGLGSNVIVVTIYVNRRVREDMRQLHASSPALELLAAYKTLCA
jgi:hypothetical protein